MNATITVTSDLQIRLIKSDVWTLPIYGAACRTNMGENMEYACPCAHITGSQFEAILAFLKPHIAGDYGMFWLFPEGTLEKITSACAGITPAYHIAWPGYTRDPDKVIDLLRQDILRFEDYDGELSPDTDDFLRHVVSKTGLIRMGDLQCIWSAVQQLGAEWLYRKRKPLDLGFTKLVALPYRSNWRAYVSCQFPGLVTLFRMKQEERDAMLAVSGFSAFMNRTTLVEFNAKDETIGWTIDSLPSDRWDDYVAKNERLRRQAVSTQARYVAWWSAVIHTMKERIYESLGNWVEKISRPNAGLDPGRNGRGQRFVALLTKGRVTVAIPEQPQLDAVYPDVTRQIEAPYAGGNMAAKDASVREMPVIRFGE